ncbi:MAG: S8 family serine peptidase [Gemmatimonadales bacterium]|nr:S8 family serine peptidase [Gemmatimonadales bacterium]
MPIRLPRWNEPSAVRQSVVPRARLTIIAAVLGMAACTEVERPTGPTSVGPQLARAEAQDTAGRYIVMLKPGLVDGNRIARDLSASFAARTHHVFTYVFDGFAADLTSEAVRLLRARPEIAVVSADRPGKPDDVTDFNAGWGLGRIDQRYGPSDFQFTYGTTGSGVNVYVLGSGVQASHPHFAPGQVVPAWTYDASKPATQPCDNHETGVASIIAGSEWGVARQAKIHSVRFSGCGIDWESNMVAAFQYVIANHVKPAIVNFSWGLPIPLSGWLSSPIANAAVAAKNAGILVVVSAGNNNENACYVDLLSGNLGHTPAAATPLLTVAATNSADQRASFSNYGNCVDIFAPGVSIDIASFQGGATTGSGTTFAAPFVTGVAALLYQKYPLDTPDQIHYAIRDGGTEGVVGNPGPSSPNLLLYSNLPVPVRVSIQGPSLVGPFMQCPYLAVVEGGRAPFTYNWYGVLNGAANQIIGSISFAGFLNINVTDAIGGTASNSKWIDVDPNNYQVFCS